MIAKTTFAPSKTPYALDLTNLVVDPDDWTRVAAIWVRRKQGVTAVCQGELRGYRYADRAAFLADFDARYGGECKARWDGESLWAPDLKPAEHLIVAERLDEVLKNLPEVPAGYEGWYKINA